MYVEKFESILNVSLTLSTALLAPSIGPQCHSIENKFGSIRNAHLTFGKELQNDHSVVLLSVANKKLINFGCGKCGQITYTKFVTGALRSR